VLAQLGLRIQHALRAFTPADAKALRATVSTYPRSDFYDVETLLTSVGIGEAAVTLLSEKGVPTPVVHTRLRAPSASMTPAPDVGALAKASPLQAKYGTEIDRESAYELLAKRVEAAPAPEPEPKADKPAPEHHNGAKQPSDPLTDFLGSRQGKQLQREVVRGVFSLLKKKL
jgi:hypothetical protein